MGNCNTTSNKWSEIPYPGQKRPYHGVEPGAGTWPLNYLKRDCKGNFLGPSGENIALAIVNPGVFNFDTELIGVEKVQSQVTPEQISMAKYWAGAIVNKIANVVLTLTDTYKISPPRAARIMSTVINTLNDTTIVTFNYKYLWDYPRPNQLNPGLKTVLNTPAHPTYPSGHSTGLSAAFVVLSYYFPEEEEKLNRLAEEASISRFYGGIHFMSDLTEGMRLGRFIGNTVVRYLKTQSDGDGAMVDFPKEEFMDAPIMPKY
ncbi:MAG: phosphatase PAP2 family protein [Clostridium sp.]|nr:phosphatase PAP2 family protein [Clostridium sp.]